MIITEEKNIKNLAVRAPAELPCFRAWARPSSCQSKPEILNQAQYTF